MADLDKKFDDAEDLSKKFDAIPGGGNQAPDSGYSTLGSAAMGAAQGATLGFDDEIGGIAKALYDKGVSGKKDNFWDLYKKTRDSIREAHSEAEAAHPVASFAGNLVGGIAPMALAPEALLGAGAAEGAGFAAKAKALANTGARVGAVAGLGGSTADLTSGDPSQVGQAVKDVASGAVGGAATGAAVGSLVNAASGPIAAGAKYVGKTIGTLPFAEDISNVFNKVAGGEDLGAPGQVLETNQNTRDVADKTVATIENLRREAGSARQENLEDLTSNGAKINVGDIVDNELKRIPEMEANATPSQQEDIQRYKALLQSLVQERVEENPSFIPKNGLPEASPEDAAKSALANRTAVAQAKDRITMANLLEQAKGETDTDTRKAILQKVLKLQENIENTNYPAEVNPESTTGMDVASVNRGPNTSPLVKAVAPDEEAAFTPIQRVTNPTVVRGREEVTPVALGEILKSLQDEKDAATSGFGRGLINDLRSNLKGRLEGLGQAGTDEAGQALPMTQEQSDALDNFKKTIDDFTGNTENFKDVASSQQMLGTPSYTSDMGQQTGTADKLQAMIKSYNRPDSVARLKIDAALDRLGESFPEAAERIRTNISEASTNHKLAKALTAESFMTGGHATLGTSVKAVGLQGVRAAAKATRGLSTQGANALEGAKASSEAMINMGNKIYDYTPSQIQNLAQYALNQGNNYGATIAKTLNGMYNAPQSKQRAVLFTLMQQPDFRKMAEDYVSGQEQ